MDGKETGKGVRQRDCNLANDGFEGKPPLKLVLEAFLDGLWMRKFCFGDNGRRSAESDKIFSGL